MGKFAFLIKNSYLCRRFQPRKGRGTAPQLTHSRLY